MFLILSVILLFTGVLRVEGGLEKFQRVGSLDRRYQVYLNPIKIAFSNLKYNKEEGLKEKFLSGEDVIMFAMDDNFPQCGVAISRPPFGLVDVIGDFYFYASFEITEDPAQKGNFVAEIQQVGLDWKTGLPRMLSMAEAQEAGRKYATEKWGASVMPASSANIKRPELLSTGSSRGLLRTITPKSIQRTLERKLTSIQFPKLPPATQD